MNLTTRILTNISADTPISFANFLDKLSEHALPRDGQFFKALESLEKMELVTIERDNGRIDTLMLTEVGAELAREALRENR